MGWGVWAPGLIERRLWATSPERGRLLFGACAPRAA